MGAAIYIAQPADGTHQFSGVPFPVLCTQQIETEQTGAAALQFAGEPDGPWTTYRNDGSGPISGPIVQWQPAVEEFTIPNVVQSAEALVRVGVWPGQGGDDELDGPPTYASPAVHWLPPITKHEHGDAPEHPAPTEETPGV